MNHEIPPIWGDTSSGSTDILFPACFKAPAKIRRWILDIAPRAAAVSFRIEKSSSVKFLTARHKRLRSQTVSRPVSNRISSFSKRAPFFVSPKIWRLPGRALPGKRAPSYKSRRYPQKGRRHQTTPGRRKKRRPFSFGGKRYGKENRHDPQLEGDPHPLSL